MATTHSKFFWTLSNGAQADERGVRFDVWAPRAQRVRVRLCGGEDEGEHELERDTESCGRFSGIVERARPGDDYMFVLDDGKPLADPASR